MNEPPEASRQSAPEVAPIEHEGVRYIQDDVQGDEGDQNGGYLAAIDAATGQRLWRLKVYDVPDYADEGLPSMGRYFQSMQLVPGQDAIEIVNETGARFRVDLAARTSTPVSPGGAEALDDPEVPPKPAPPE